MVQPLILTGFGGLLAIFGSTVGYLLQSRETRQARSALNAREDRFRLHQDRREVYRDFHLAFGRARAQVEIYLKSRDNPELLLKARKAREKVWEAWVPLWHIGAEEVIQAAWKIRDVFDDVGWHGADSSPEHWVSLVFSYVLAVRNDLLGQESSLEEAAARGALRTGVHNYPYPFASLDELTSLDLIRLDKPS